MDGWSHQPDTARAPDAALRHDKIDPMPGVRAAGNLSRRCAIGVFSGGILLACTGCGVRLERDAPHIPGLSTQGPPADQAVLLAALDAERAAAAAGIPADAVGKALHTAHTAQAAKLAEVIAALGIAAALPTPASSANLAQLEHHGLTPAVIAAAAAAETSHRAMLASILALRAAAATALNAPVALGNPAPSARLATQVLPELREAVYGFEVIVARTPITSRALPAATVQMLYSVRSRWDHAAGSSGTPDPLGYSLNGDFGNPQVRSSTARQLLQQVATAAAARAATKLTPGELTALIDVWSSALAYGWRWGATPTAFPNLRNP